MGTIAIHDICIFYEIEPTFIHELESFGIIELLREADQIFIDEEQLAAIERYRQWHYNLQINMEGIDTIKRLLQKQIELQREVTMLQNRLRLYESEQNINFENL